ncbi:hypothetical protein Y032_0012g1903 [Ancylostoma ceylanicum]|uniref:Uncharacterized protein n=1 Tax=Ancylostoma ceylanicum TaxID=53326 RepID=A0A016VDF4_9BILA|nr:hypothetical protein Y032_0012g1903 [Ancylostoma ceylanicum]
MSYYNNSFNANPNFLVITPSSNFVASSPPPMRVIAQPSSQIVLQSTASPPQSTHFVARPAPPPRFIAQPPASSQHVAQPQLQPAASPRFIAQSPLTQRLLAQSQPSSHYVVQPVASPRFIAQSPLTQRLLTQSQTSPRSTPQPAATRRFVVQPAASPTLVARSSQSCRPPAPSLQQYRKPRFLNPRLLSAASPRSTSSLALTSLIEDSSASARLSVQTPLSVSLFESSDSPPCLTPLPQHASPRDSSTCSTDSSTPPSLSPPASPPPAQATIQSLPHPSHSPTLSDGTPTTYQGRWQVSKQGKHRVLVYNIPEQHRCYSFLFHKKKRCRSRSNQVEGAHVRVDVINDEFQSDPCMLPHRCIP